MDGTLETGRTLRAILTGTGRAGPIEERLGRRLVRLVDPESEEGRSLLDSGRVTLSGPEGESLGPIAIESAWRRLRARLERALEDPACGPDEGRAVREGLEALPSTRGRSSEPS
ncbi:MAG TPA: hypothetical protein VLV48_07530 [Thermoanaerobaculia bacterium]|nr:hypothetical protein [Thermoanaerobaculia bacterium]